MDSKNDLLKDGLTTLIAVVFVLALLALAGKANAAVDVEQTVAYSPTIAFVTR